MTHPFMEAISDALVGRSIATLRYQFPFMEARAGGRRPPPNKAAVLEQTVRSACRRAKKLARGLPLVAGGKSMGGRMTSRVACGELSGVLGVVLLGFPLHPAKKPEKVRERAAHLSEVAIPMLFVQGTRDQLGSPQKIRRVVKGLGEIATLYPVRDADHGFSALVRSGRTQEEITAEVADAVRAWVTKLLKPR